MACYDFLIIGAGIVGLGITRELARRYPDASILVLEKEPETGCHSSGRNSGVLHSGIYYPPESLKARVCAQGAKEIAELCEQHHLPLRRCGKVLVATRPEDAPQLTLLADRARINRIQIEELDEKGLTLLEPEARSATGTALFIPSTAVGSPKAVLHVIQKELIQKGRKICFNAAVISVNVKERQVVLQTGARIHYGHAINTAGLHADTVAHLFDAGHRYTLLPFKGIYWQLDPNAGFVIRHLIYPVPDLRVPFLGVHTTTTTDGNTYLGPTAVPAFGRENYRGLQGVEPFEFFAFLSLLARQYIRGFDGFRRLAWQEGSRYLKPWFVKAGQGVLPRLCSEHLVRSPKVGIRAQMLDRKTGRLVTDFVVEKGECSTHILNAISPAWTSAFPFARYVCDNFIEKS
jgi:L-2-hydroxyglutarate oxidase LhgO